jgi:hypothetical protein
VRIEVSEEADWKLFEDAARVLEKGLGGCWKERLDSPDQRYWDLVVDEHTLTLHLEHYLGISVVIPDGADEIARRVCALLKQPTRG